MAKGVSEVEWSGTWHERLALLVNPSGANQHAPFVSLDLCHIKSQCRSKEIHWKLEDIPKGKRKCFHFPPCLSLNPSPTIASSTASFGTAAWYARGKIRTGLLVFQLSGSGQHGDHSPCSVPAIFGFLTVAPTQCHSRALNK